MLTNYKTMFLAFISILTIALTSTNSAHADVTKVGNNEGPVLVFLPGLSSHGDLWAPWVKQFQATHSIYILSVNGFAGVPSKAMKDSFLEDTIGEVITELRKDGVTDAKLIGHSIGGLMSMMIAYNAPDVVGELMIVDALPKLSELFLPGMTSDQVAQQAGAMAQGMRAMEPEAYKQQQKMGLGRLSQDQEFLKTLGLWTETSDQMTVAQAFEEALTIDYKPMLPSITVPTTVLAGHNKNMPYDIEALRSFYAVQYATLPNVTVKAVANSYHFIMIDRPVVFTAELVAFVAE